MSLLWVCCQFLLFLFSVAWDKFHHHIRNRHLMFQLMYMHGVCRLATQGMDWIAEHKLSALPKLQIQSLWFIGLPGDL